MTPSTDDLSWFKEETRNPVDGYSVDIRSEKFKALLRRLEAAEAYAHFGNLLHGGGRILVLDGRKVAFSFTK